MPVTQLVSPDAQLVTVEREVEYFVFVTQTRTTSVESSGGDVVSVNVDDVVSSGGVFAVSLMWADTTVVEETARLVTEGINDVEVAPTLQPAGLSAPQLVTT